VTAWVSPTCPPALATASRDARLAGYKLNESRKTTDFPSRSNVATVLLRPGPDSDPSLWRRPESGLGLRPPHHRGPPAVTLAAARGERGAGATVTTMYVCVCVWGGGFPCRVAAAPVPGGVSGPRAVRVGNAMMRLPTSPRTRRIMPCSEP
jgi:hypothetical protein